MNKMVEYQIKIMIYGVFAVLLVLLLCLGAYADGCSGIQYNGFCWFMGGEGDSCNDVCDEHGGVDSRCWDDDSSCNVAKQFVACESCGSFSYWGPSVWYGNQCYFRGVGCPDPDASHADRAPLCACTFSTTTTTTTLPQANCSDINGTCRRECNVSEEPFEECLDCPVLHSCCIPKTAAEDTTPPAISNILVRDITAYTAKITWVTDESANSTVDYGNTTGLENTSSNTSFTTTHSVTLAGLEPETTYYFKVLSTDEWENAAKDDNAGNYYNFITEVAKADLTVTDITWTPASPKEGDIVGQNIFFDITVKNIGEEEVCSLDAILQLDDQEICSVSGTQLSPGNSYTLNCEGYAEVVLTAGEHELNATVDPSNVVDEANENNNELIKRMPPICVYCAPHAWNYKYTTYISYVNFGQISQSSDRSHYSDFSSISTPVLPGHTYSLNVTRKVETDYFGTGYVRAWVDWNHNCIFDSDERYDLLSSPKYEGYQNFSTEIKVPITAVLGKSRMRIFVSNDCSYGYIVKNDPCKKNGCLRDAEDYSIEVELPPIDEIPPTISVTGALSDGTNIDTLAEVNCHDVFEGCNISTYKLKVYDSNPGSCPVTYEDYDLNSPQTISSRKWVCGAAKDNAGNIGFSSITPTLSVTAEPSIETRKVVFTATASDDVIGLKNITIYVNDLEKKTCSISPCVYEGGSPSNDYNYFAKACDNAGNCDETEVKFFDALLLYNKTKRTKSRAAFICNNLQCHPISDGILKIDSYDYYLSTEAIKFYVEEVFFGEYFNDKSILISKADLTNYFSDGKLETKFVPWGRMFRDGVSLEFYFSSGSPVLDIRLPEDKSYCKHNKVIDFENSAVGGTPPYTYSWTSNIDGDIGNSQSFSRTLNDGHHTITLTVTDTNGKTSEDSVEITVLYNTFDWRNYKGKDWMTPVKSQGSCGSCWAFVAVGAAEAVYKIEQNNANLNPDLSEQYLVSCFGGGWNPGGCCGGDANLALNYMKNQGISEDSCFPYKDRRCNCNGCKYNSPCSNCQCSDRCNDWKSRLWKITSFGKITGRDKIKAILIENGPLVASMNINAWDGWDCNGQPGQNHGVVIIGYNDAQGNWIVRNSWGGAPSYFKVKYGECAIENYVYYVDGVNKP